MTLPSCLIPPPRAQSLTLIAARDLRPGDVIVYGDTLLELDDVQHLGADVLLVGRVEGTVSIVASAFHVFQRMGRLVPMVRV